MGDRGNVLIREEGGGEIYFYSHWTGSDLPIVVARALERGRSRWDDESYLSRIIFSQMISDGGALADTTGFGISTEVTDGEAQIVVVDMKAQTVTANGETLSFDNFTSKGDEPDRGGG